MAVIQCPHCAKPVMAPDTPALLANLADVCRSFPELCSGVRTIQTQLGIIGKNVANLPNRGEHPAPSQEVIKEWLGCRDCAPKFEALLKEHPELFKTGGEVEEESEVPFYAKPGFGRE
jgi:hypothetical protein